MTELLTLEEVVVDILEKHAETRCDDYLLYVAVCSRLQPDAMKMSFDYVMKNHYDLLPNWESVTRARRKVQERRKDLVIERTKRKRQSRIKTYIEYARS